MNNATELSPCPFCGHEHPSFERLGTPRQSCIVVCGNCGCRHESSDEGERSGSSWNTRSASPAPGWEPLTEARIEELYDLACCDWNNATSAYPSVGVFLARRIFATLGIAPAGGIGGE